MYNGEILAKRLKQLRTNRGFSIRDMGAIVGISHAAISLYENEKRTPTAKMIFNYAEYFDVTSDYLLGLSNERR
jgi:transcriptional regulator with XRE-family HTH domain